MTNENSGKRLGARDLTVLRVLIGAFTRSCSFGPCSGCDVSECLVDRFLTEIDLLLVGMVDHG
jgi:hypothetical protein